MTPSNSKKPGGKKTILLVPGFLRDTYSEIESSFVELTADKQPDIDFVWLVPGNSGRAEHYQKHSPDSPAEPLYVRHLRKNNIRFVVGNISKFNVLANYLLFREIFRDCKIDAVYTHFGFERYWATLFGRLFGRTTIWNEHWHSIGTRQVLIKKLFYRMFVDYFISISQFISSTLPEGCKVFTVLNSIGPAPDKQAQEQDIQSQKQLLGISPEKIVVLMVAAFTPQKRHRLALEICELVLHERTDLLFIFLGEGTERQHIAGAIAEKGLEKNFLLPGYVNNVADYYTVADVCMLTSRNEGFGYCALEAMKFGLPMVAFASGGLVEIIRHQETGMLIAEADPKAFAYDLLRLADDKLLRDSMGVCAQALLREKFDRGEWKDKMMQVLRSILWRPTH